MTPKQRMAAAMNMQPADKIPFMCQMSIGHMLTQLGVSPVQFWFDKNIFRQGLLTLREMYSFDGILISLHGHDPEWEKSAARLYRTEETEVVEWKNGDKTFCPFNDLPFYEFTSENTGQDINDFDPDSLPEVLNYIPVSQNLHFAITRGHEFDVITEIVAEAGGEFSIHGEVTSPFDYFLDLFGHQNGLMALIDNPENSKKVLGRFALLIKNLAVEMCGTGVDAIKISSPFAGAGFISTDDYREFVLPYEMEIARAVRDKGVHIYTHTCGSIGDRLELMFDAGISGIECLDPAPIGNVELGDAVERIGNKGFIKGNVDSVNLLLSGTQEEIRSEVEKIIGTGSKHSGFILSTACSIAPAVERENILLMSEIIDKWNPTKNSNSLARQ